MSATEKYIVSRKPELKDPTLLVCWNQDAGSVGQDVFKYLDDRLSLTLFAEIEPAEFFPLRGVLVDGDVAQFPESKFYYCSEKDLVILKSSVPRFEWYEFIKTVLEISQKVCHVNKICTLGGMISISAHTMPRILMATMNKPEIKSILCDFDINLNLGYESPPGQ
jgi:proteasome assembly chaperone (PAC2) family protein